MAYHRAFSSCPDRATGTAAVNRVNSNNRIGEVFRETPFGGWLRRLERDIRFRNASELKPIVDSVNCLIGAVCLRHGFEACSFLETLLFGGESVSSGEDALHARSKLQAMVQSVAKERSSELIRIDTRFGCSRTCRMTPEPKQR